MYVCVPVFVRKKRTNIRDLVYLYICEMLCTHMCTYIHTYIHISRVKRARDASSSPVKGVCVYVVFLWLLCGLLTRARKHVFSVGFFFKGPSSLRNGPIRNGIRMAQDSGVLDVLECGRRRRLLCYSIRNVCIFVGDCGRETGP